MKTSLALATLALATISFAGCVVHDSSASYHHQHPVYEQAPPPAVVYQPAPGYQPGPPPPVGYQPQPVVVQEIPPPQRVVVVQEPPPQPVLVVRNSPPPRHVEVIPANPGRGAVSSVGCWVAQPTGWVWVSGRWAVPPHPNAVWVAPRWDQHGSEFHFSVGVWQ